MGSEKQTEVLVLGGGPGGYTAAFRAADLGKRVTLVERYSVLGGVCLNVGCIPSKALLHSAKVIRDAEHAAAMGIDFAKPNINPTALRRWTEASVIGKLTAGLSALAKQRGVDVVRGTAQFVDPHQVTIAHEGAAQTIRFEHAIIAAGSHATKFPGAPVDERIMDSTDALELKEIPKRMLIIGGGIIGLELGEVYSALGSAIDVVEFTDALVPGADADLVRPLAKILAQRFENIMLETKVTGLVAKPDGIYASFEGTAAAKDPQRYDRVLVAIGRRPNGKNIAAEKAGVAVNERGFIPVDAQMRTNLAHIYAIGDIVGEPMLAHKATHQAKVAAEVICGHKVEFSPVAIPGVAYTDPEIAWAGVSEKDAKAKGIEIRKAIFPWAASGRALANARSEGMTKLIFSVETNRLIGAGIVGPGAGDLISEAVLAIEMGADADDIALTIHPHPTLGETIGLAAEVANGSITDLLAAKPK